MKIQTVFHLVFVCALPVLGCEARVSLGGRCMTDAQCPRPLVCGFGRCRAECATASDCRDPGAFCIGEPGSGVCSVPSVDTCANDCTDGLVCAGELCSVPCTPGDATCLPGSSCGPERACEASPRTDAGVPDSGSADAGPRVATSPHLLCNGFEVACVVNAGRVFCWGNNHLDQLGDGNVDHGALCPLGAADQYDCSRAPIAPVLDELSGTTLTDVISIGCGEAFACALTGGGRVLCWGQPGAHLGVMAITAPRALEVIASGAVELTVGYAHVCSLTSEGFVCWGLNGEGDIDGRLGLPTGAAAETPTRVASFDELSLLSAGRFATCGVTASGSVWCSGDGSAYGVADPAGRTIVGLSGVRALSVGSIHACALGTDGAFCWGGNTSGQLGAGVGGPDCGDSCHRAATRVIGSDGSLRALSHGASDHTCAIDAAGQVRCWGYQPCGDAGVDPAIGDSVRMLGPVVQREDGTALTGVVEVAVGGSTCARTGAGEVWCWGLNNYGQLGFFETSSAPAGCPSMPYYTAHLIPAP